MVATRTQPTLDLAADGYDFEHRSLDELLAEACMIRQRVHGSRITYSPKVFIPLTMLCRDKCGYCVFAQPPARLQAPFLSEHEVLSIARAGAAAGCHEALFTLGERPELRYSLAASWLQEHGFGSTVEYLAHICKLVLQETDLLPHVNAGALYPEELALLRSAAASVGMMLETTADLQCHRNSPDKTPQRRLSTLEAAGQLSMPFTTGILVGIGETRVQRIQSLQAISESHQRWGHVQEVIIQNFLPKPNTAMATVAPCEHEEYLEAIALARIILPEEVHLQAPPNLSEDFGRLLDAGIDDWGGISPVTLDYVNPERPWPVIERLREVTEAKGFVLAPRLTIYPEYALHPERWLAEPLLFPVLEHSDAEGLGREDDNGWYAGVDVRPPDLLSCDRIYAGHAIVNGQVGEVLQGVNAGQEVGLEEIVALFGARGSHLRGVTQVADELRKQAVGNDITWVANRNINYTNVCTFKCRFCAFSKGPLSLNLRGDPYLLSLEDIAARTVEAAQAGASEVCLQGGIHPNFDGDYYIQVTRAVKAAVPKIHVHGFTALEVTEGAKRLQEPLADYLKRLMDAGLRSLPGTAAEILDDEIRQIMCSDKISTEEWLEAHRTAHNLGLRSNVTIMFGAVEQPLHWARHLLRTRQLQKETGGFTELVPLPFVHMAAPIYLQKRARRGPTFREALLMHSVGRIAYHNWIPNIQASWVKLGLAGAAQMLQAGANDLGGTLMNENISRAAGAAHGQEVTPEDLQELCVLLNRPLRQRSTLYDEGFLVTK
ncbi:MAG: 7,8-didemethyl-8-hydroxy-5-deazariboflavin synthase subunit CofH [Acidimicrobiia bacterium]|nr:7,8-didemethyl-8-hydroxy-5-deazariboflavin synthase subunit CofH [Acidimicrobiia bacterium]MYC58499.1 7,8-didemethyl-8-hydroxy-5-deazariboflavin synthase subunit CofH [Acidimicrobiia bacterium]MYG94257.1 7,8-didemethyl-8-hydroxy-5-deazariboflavin synthase subunit CofH [Acidimicrobiia bacterium]MYI30395.1 7,8-didemethyl-8-hydroxy-5-deazariboflavin synthase subunit CofH [Acidimicrobiia bacterium]